MMGKLEEQIKLLAMELGFDSVGITSADDFYFDEQVAVSRVREGLLDGMNWITEDRMQRSARPKELLPGAKSVISLAMSYYSGDFKVTNFAKPKGKIARYAWGQDYHNIIKIRLKQFVEQMSKVVKRTPNARFFVDDGPMLDRAAAQRAGVGWFGKNTNILTINHGSWVFLGEVITDLALEHDNPLRKNCGKCVLCIDKCPTGAIVSPYVIDARRCISYLTIECRGPIPRQLRHLVGDWIFGCDICQEVCPVNINVLPTNEKLFRQSSGFSALDLIPLLQMTDDDFRRIFKNSPIKRAKRIGLQRNVCVALGNIGDRISVEALIIALNTAEPLIKAHAAWALGRIGGIESKSALREATSIEVDHEVLREINMALSDIRN
jgi:epoxyqueuosine reductase